MPEIQVRTKRTISRNELKNLYWNKKLTIRQVSKKFGFNYNFKIYRLMKEYNIPTRSHSETLKGRKMLKKRKKFNSKKMSPKLAYLFGVIKGDGHIAKNFIHITTSNYNFAKILREKLQSWSRLNVTIKNYKTGRGNVLWYVFLSSVEAVELFKSLKLLSLKTDEEKTSFIRGFADAEGSVVIFKNWDNKNKKYKRNYKVAMHNSDKVLIHGIQNLLFSLGIKSSIYQRVPKNSFGKSLRYELVISHKSMKRFSEIVSFNYPEKAEKLNKTIGGENKCP
ncbi:MAG: LAGLIDADG family homing endonuclease, partial [Methanosarcinales archaeon]